MLYHLISADDWESATRAGIYRPDSLGTEGFVHLSERDQVASTASRFFAGRSDLLLLEIDETRVTSEIRREDLYGHGSFPHLYGPLNLLAVVRVSTYSPES